MSEVSKSLKMKANKSSKLKSSKHPNMEINKSPKKKKKKAQIIIDKSFNADDIAPPDLPHAQTDETHLKKTKAKRHSSGGMLADKKLLKEKPLVATVPMKD